MMKITFLNIMDVCIALGWPTSHE